MPIPMMNWASLDRNGLGVPSPYNSCTHPLRFGHKPQSGQETKDGLFRSQELVLLWSPECKACLKGT